MNIVSSKTTIKDCIECNKIRCRKCGWEANKEETLFVQKEVLTSCPKCGWKP